ncbi:MAG: hypothetical protein HRT68_03860 [Flavobacteriaceae bacterium]|nr:hypothetical protein [Flavobacteriaceae bacterium]
MNTSLLWEQHHKEVEHLVFTKVKRKEVVQDLVQEIFKKVHEKKESTKPSILSIADHTVDDYLSKEHFDNSNNEVSEKRNSLKSLYMKRIVDWYYKNLA